MFSQNNIKKSYKHVVKTCIVFKHFSGLGNKNECNIGYCSCMGNITYYYSKIVHFITIQWFKCILVIIFFDHWSSTNK